MMSEDCVERAAVAAANQLGYDSFRGLQLEVIKGVVSGQDVFAVLPTGYGKSLCYACLPAVFDSLHQPSEPTIVCVVTPLTAIIHDQVTSFSSKGLKAAGITGNIDADVAKGVVNGDYQLLFFTPEMLLNHRVWRQLFCRQGYATRLKAFVTDEAHTIKMWGDTFRSTMLRLGEIRSIIPDAHCLAVTATATRSLRLKICSILGMHNPLVFAVSPCKKNLLYTASQYASIEETFAPLLMCLKERRTCMPRVIIYCRRYDDCSNLYIYFKRELGSGFTDPCGAPDLSKFRLVEMFSSCTDDEVKKQIIESFTSQSPLRCVCATVAFGMGLDCPDVKQVIHLGAPNDIECYIQETGRAGRNGKPAKATLLIENHNNQYRDKGILKYQRNTSVCRRDILFQDTDNYKHIDYGTKCMCCDICAKTCTCGRCDDINSEFIHI